MGQDLLQPKLNIKQHFKPSKRLNKNLNQNDKNHKTLKQMIITYVVNVTLIEVDKNSNKKEHQFQKKFEQTNNRKWVVIKKLTN